MQRLHPDNLASLAAQVRTPSYDWRATGVGIVHLGLGAFHRAHQAVFTEDAMEQGGGNWGIVGVSLRSPAVSRQLLPQGGLYSVLSQDGQANELRVIAAVKDVLVARDKLHAVVAAIASPAIKILTLTITEKGYCLAAGGQALDSSDEQIVADLANPEQPCSAIGVLALGLRERQRAGSGALTVISCDNLSENSKLLRLALADYLAASFPDVLPWMGEQVRFPCSMVDRIVPAMTSEQRERQSAALGLDDEAAVCTEPFKQWIIEDNFAAARPAWDAVGVQFVTDILPYENIKLRLLNASHSAIAYCGLLAGKVTVDEVMSDAGLRGFVERLMCEDLMPALDVPVDFDLGAYRDALLARFSNPCLAHRCEQIAMDGSEKIAQRWLPTLQVSQAPVLRRALAAWCFFILFTDADINDPRAQQLQQFRKSEEPMAQRIAGVLACAGIAQESAPAYPALQAEIERNIDTLLCGGIQAFVAA